jgi:di/tricarboxylate transporter
MIEQSIVFGALLLALLLFVWGKWRYDLVALLALLAVAVTGVVPASEAFLGFGHPAVVTVAAVLVVSRALLNSGVVDVITSWMARVGERPALQIAALTGLAALLSGFVNNVGALALLMPVAIRMARKGNTSPSRLLMPLAFGSLLGGMTTLIGTPPNIIIAEFRATVADEPFRMFSFMPVGVGVALAGLLFVTLVGWRLMPQRKAQASSEALFRVEDYVAEVRIPEGATMVGKTPRGCGGRGRLQEALADLGCLPLAERELRLG